MATATLSPNGTVGRPPNHQPANAGLDVPDGLAPASPAAAVSRYGYGPALLWAGGLDPGFRRRGPFFVPDDVKCEMDTDDTVKQCWTIVKGLTLDREPTLICPYDYTTKNPSEQQKAEYKQARMVGDFLEHVFRTAEGGMWQWDYQMLDAMKAGMMVAVIVAKPEKYDGDGKGQVKWTLDYLQILKRNEYTAYFDEGGRLVGFQVFGQTTTEGVGDKAKEVPVIWPREKFVVATFQPEYGGIWGNDLYAAAYLMYMLKNKGWEEWFAAMQQIGSPTAWHTTPTSLTPNQKVELTDGDGNTLYYADETKVISNISVIDLGYGVVKVSPQVAQHYTLQQGLRSLGLVGLAGDATLQYLQAQDSQNLPSFVEAGTVGIHCAMVGTDKYAKRGTHESSGSSEAGERIASFPANDGKFMLEQVRGQLCRSFTLWNYGANMLHYRPRVDYGSGIMGDVAAIMNSLASMSTTGRLTDGQIQHFAVNRVGFPQATAQELAERPETAAVASTGNRPNDTAGTGTKVQGA